MNKVYLFVPNLIGYARIATAIAAYWFAFENPGLFLITYVFSFVADALDGMAARALNQCSRFGAVLDMVVDRAATSGLIVILSHLLGISGSLKPYHKEVCFTGAMLVGLDIVSHFARMYAGLVLKHGSHKDAHTGRFWLLDIYYGNRKVMGAFCVGQEFFYIGMYILHFAQAGPVLGALASAMNILIYPLAVLCLLKQATNVFQFLDSMAEIGLDDLRALSTKDGKSN
jgi:CDP-diacylglycerol--inositol 3-phosphatidyltransferase